MAKQQAQAKKSPAAAKKPAAPAAKPAPAPATKPEAEKPVVALVPDQPAAAPARRGRPPGSAPAAAEAKRGRKASKAKAKGPSILYLIETEEGSETFEIQNLGTASELLDLMDQNRKVIATRTWREF